VKRLFSIALVFFALTELLLGWWLWSNSTSRIQRSLSFHQAELATGFRSVVDSHAKLVETSLNHLILNRDLLPLLAEAAANDDSEKLRGIRGRLYRRLYRDFENLKGQDVRMLQFVLPDGRSLLRFNRPDLYDDLISKDRPLLANVLHNGRAGAAFEHGRICPGFRYAFPLYYGDKLVGIVDFTLSYDGIRHTFQKSKQVTGTISQIVLRRDLFEAVSHPSTKSLYLPTKSNPGFIVEDEKSPFRDIQQLIPLPDWVDELDDMLRQNPAVQQAMSSGESYSLPLCVTQGNCYGVALHPVIDSSNRPAAYIIAYTNMPEYQLERRRSLITFGVGSLILLVTAVAIRRWLKSRVQLQAISKHMGEGMYVVNRTGKIIYTNPAASYILGYTEAELRGTDAHELFHVHSNNKKVDGNQCPIRNKPMQGIVYGSDAETFRCKDGELLRTSVTSSPLRDESGISGAVVLFRDISKEYEDQRRLRQANIALRQLAEGVLVADTEGKIVAVNRAFFEITGYEDKDVLGKTPAILASGKHGADFYEKMWHSILNTGYWEGEIWNRRKDGEIYPEWLKITVMEDEEGNRNGFVGVFSDITELRRNENRLRDLAYHDQLTGLYNRTAFIELLEHSLHRAHRRKEKLAVLFLDLDRFKRINDTLGHSIGDELLQETARRLRTIVREEDEVARLGGDEFTILLEDIQNTSSAIAVANKVLEVMRQPFNLESKKLDISVSIGISLFPRDGSDSATLLKNSDAAMYLAKQDGRDCCRRFVQGMDYTSLKLLELEQELHQALERDELVLFYQPKVAIPSGSVIGLEALIRWQHPERGLLAPFHFLHVAEEAGLMEHLTKKVLLMATNQRAKWKREGIEDVSIAVNLDTQFLNRPDAETTLDDALKLAGIEPQDLELEITETAMVQEPHHSDLWQRLSELGFRISIDDFGTGESSLTRLKILPVEILKVDQSFVRDLEHNENDRAIVQTVIAMANTLGKEVIAEGVETEAQLRFLYQSGCRKIQGYYFSRPLPSDEIEPMFKSNYFAAKAAACESETVSGNSTASLDNAHR
jgi:diguanylate cyclase (GGDEF)-like protein/PAS domain S-box-containing protein